MKHIEFVRASTNKPLVVLRNEIRHSKRVRKTTSHAVDHSAPFLREIREDTVILNGKSRKIRRLFVSSEDSGEYEKLGWVASCDVHVCMICLVHLSSYSAKHHCRACGNVTCSKCSSEEAIVLELSGVGPVRVCNQCYWGQAHVSAFFNDHLGHAIEISHHEVFRSAEISEDVERPDLRCYGKLKMASITPSFVIKTRRSDRSIVFINICTCTEVPVNTDPAPATNGSDKTESYNLIYMVGGPIKNISVSAEEQAFLDKERVHLNSIYDVAVNPAVIQGSTQVKREMLCEQILEFISTKYPEGDFSVYQYVESMEYVTENNYPIGNKSPVTVTAMSSAPSSERELHVLDMLHAKLAIPTLLCFRRLQQVVSDPSDVTDRPAGAEDTEYDDYDSSPHAAVGQFASMVHFIMKNKLRKTIDAVAGDATPTGEARAESTGELPADQPHSSHHHHHHHHHEHHQHLYSAETKSITFIGTPGFVIKTHKVTPESAPDHKAAAADVHFSVEQQHKVFINVLHHPVVDAMLDNQSVALRQSELPLIVVSEVISHTTDNKGRRSLLYHVAVGSSYFKPEYAEGDIKITAAVYIRKIIRAVNNKYNETLDLRQYVLPKVKKGYMGEGIELMTYCFHTKASDPVVALLHDLHTIKEVKQRGGSVVGSVVGSVDCRSYKHMGDEDDDVSELSEETPDWLTVAGIGVHDQATAGTNNKQTQNGPLNGKKTSRFSLSHGMKVNNEGKALLITEDMTSYIKILTLPQEEAKLLKKRAVEDVHVLLGWQVILPTTFSENHTVVYVVTGIRKNSLRKTEYRLSSRDQDDFWIKLRRSDAKSGEVFWPLRKVLFLDLPTAGGETTTTKHDKKKRFSLF